MKTSQLGCRRLFNLALLLAALLLSAAPSQSRNLFANEADNEDDSLASESLFKPAARAELAAKASKHRAGSAASSTTSRGHGHRPQLGLKKRQEQLCPNEYHMCWCDYVSNSNDNNHARLNTKNSLVLVSHSIMVDCQPSSLSAHITKTNQPDDKSKHAAQPNRKSVPNKTLSEIPRILASSSGPTSTFKSKNLMNIVYLDLSYTEIREIPSDAFQGMMGLQTIIITNCKHLKKIKMFAFRNLPNLKTLIIANNPALNELEHHALGGLNNLEYLSVGQNSLHEIEGFVFSQSTSIKIIDFIGNPIKRIKNNAFHGLKNVSDLILSLHVNATPIVVIEEDSFISTAFVDRIYLESVPMKRLQTNAFRGLSFCKNLLFSFSGLEEIEANAFFRANNIEKLSFHRSRLRRIHPNAFNEMRNIDTIDLRENYISKLNKNVFETVLAAKSSSDAVDRSGSGGGFRAASKEMAFGDKRHHHKRLLLEQNPLHCDCNLAWILNNTHYLNQISLPEICAGPKGYDCLRLSELSLDSLACSASGAPSNKPPSELPCSDIVFDLDKTAPDKDIYSISAQKPKEKPTDEGRSDEDNYDEYDDQEDEYRTEDEGETRKGHQPTPPILIASSIVEEQSRSTAAVAPTTRAKWNPASGGVTSKKASSELKTSGERDNSVRDEFEQLLNRTRDSPSSFITANTTNSAISSLGIFRPTPSSLVSNHFVYFISSSLRVNYSKLLTNFLFIECSISTSLTYITVAFLLKDVLSLV